MNYLKLNSAMFKLDRATSELNRFHQQLEASNSVNVLLQEKYNQMAFYSNKATDEVAYWRQEKNETDVELATTKSILAQKEGRLEDML
jgi:hypothetical protein